MNDEIFTRTAGGVEVTMPFPLPTLLTGLLDRTSATGSLAADPFGAGPVTVPADPDDLFSALEAELAADRLRATLADRRTENATAVRQLVAAANTDGDLRAVLTGDQAQHLLEWLNAQYVSLRQQELLHAGQVPAVGAAQSGLGLLGMDELVLDAEGMTQSELADLGVAEAEMDPVTLLCAFLVEQLSEVAHLR
jgi:hypothetical protein